MSKEGIEDTDNQTDWEAAWKALLWSFAGASLYTLLASWLPQIHSFPIASWVGLRVVTDWGWEVTPSMGYIGQGMIMGPKTAFSMLAGAVVGKLLVLQLLLLLQTVVMATSQDSNSFMSLHGFAINLSPVCSMLRMSNRRKAFNSHAVHTSQQGIH